MNNVINNEDKMTSFIDKFCYLVVFPDKKVELFKSLRDIQKEICIDASTISKKLKDNKYIFKAKGSEHIFFIKNINEDYLNCPQQEILSSYSIYSNPLSSKYNACPTESE